MFIRRYSMPVIAFLAMMAVYSQTTLAQACPPQFAVCLTQEQMNANAAKLRELEALKAEKIPELQNQVLAEKINVLDVKKTAAENEVALREKNIELLVKVGTLTGQLIGAESERNRLIGQVEFLNKNGRQKCQPFSICF